VEAIHRGDSEWGDTRPGPDERALAVEIDTHGLSAGCKGDATADHVFPSPAVESVVPEAGDDPVVRDEPRSWVRLSRSYTDSHKCRGAIGGEVKRRLGPNSLAFVENDADMEGTGAGISTVV